MEMMIKGFLDFAPINEVHPEGEASQRSTSVYLFQNHVNIVGFMDFHEL